MKVLYIFAGKRKFIEKEWRKGRAPDTYLLGLNYMKDFGINAQYIETSFMDKLRKINFNLTALPLLFKVSKFDIVFSGSSLLFPFLFRVCMRIKKPKLVWYNTFFTNAIRRSSKIKKLIILKTIKSLDAIICPSTAQYDFLIKQGVSKDKLFLVLNGVDVEFIQEKQKNINQGSEDYILSVGKDMGRDYKILIKAVEGLDTKVKIAAMPRNIKVKNIPTNVEFLGMVPFDELLGLYKNAKFIVIPTRNENYSDASDCSGQYVLLDSFASGKAIIASRRSSLADYVKDREDIVLVNAEDSEALRELILFLIDNPDKIKSMEEKSMDKSNLYTTENFARRLSEVFYKVVTN